MASLRDNGELWLMIGEVVEKEIAARLREITGRLAALEAQAAGAAEPGSGDAPIQKQAAEPAEALVVSPDSGDDGGELKERSDTLCLEDVEEEATRECQYQLQESIWDAALFIGMPAVGTGGSTFLVIGLLCNMLLQWTFSYVIYSSFLQLQMLPSVEDAWEWREAQGHQFSNMFTATRTSLTRAICDGNGVTLTTSNLQHGLINSIRAYTEPGTLGIPLGAMLCVVVLLSWALSICQELQALGSFAAAVLRVPQASDTKLSKSGGKLALASCTFRRKCFMVGILFFRWVIAMCLCIFGSIWLARTLSIVELVLNAAALSFIMTMDELIFDTLAPTPTRVIVQDMEPLATPRAFAYKGLTATAPVNLVSTITVVLLIFVLCVLPNMALMDDITDAICGGYKDFVVSDSALEVIIGTGTNNPFGQTRPKSFSRQAVRDVIELHALAPADKVLNMVRYDTFLTMQQSPMGALVSLVAQQLLATKCEDYAFGAPSALHTFKTTLRQALGADVETCADAVDYCHGDSRLLRLVCPTTCGCDDPHSGLFKNGANEGCPHQMCIDKAKYMNKLSSIPCADYNISELLGIPGWGIFVTQFTDVWIKNQPNFADQYQEALPLLLAHGCGALDLVNPTIKPVLCTSSVQFGSIRPYCPASCGCAREFAPECPTQCLEEPP